MNYNGGIIDINRLENDIRNIEFYINEEKRLLNGVETSLQRLDDQAIVGLNNSLKSKNIDLTNQFDTMMRSRNRYLEILRNTIMVYKNVNIEITSYFNERG